jgi:hypothetical protein
MKGLFKVTYTYQSYSTSNYDGSVITKERELFCDYHNDNGIKKPDYINEYRLGGFERATIKIIETEFIRDMFPVEITDFDLERNELSVIISLDEFLKSTLNHDMNFENEVLEYAEKHELDTEDALEAMGYVQRVHDNSYNYCSDLENDIDYKVYTLTEDDGSEWFYDDTAIVLVNEHHGLDARSGYSLKGIYKCRDYDGLSYFLDQHIGVSVMDDDYNEVENFENMDGSLSRLCESYTLISCSDNQEIKVKNENGDVFNLCFNTPAYGV